MNWEYLVESVSVDKLKETTTLNHLGVQGWEVVFCLPDSTDPRWIFVLLKRPRAT